MKRSIEEQLNTLNHSPASDPHPQWVASLRSRLEWTMARGTMPALPSLGQPSPFAWLRRPFAIASLSLALLLVLGGGITYAAQGAVPGNPLYALKLTSEEVRLKLATNTTARTNIELELANRRVDEFRVLSASNKVTPETAAQLSASYETHVSAALTALPTLPQEIIQNLTESIANTVDAHVEIAAAFEKENEAEKEENDTKEPRKQEEEQGAGQPRTQAIKDAREKRKQKREDIRKQAERMREFARESLQAVKLYKASGNNADFTYEMKVETDDEGKAHVKINAERKKNGKEQKNTMEFTVPSGDATATDIVIPLFKDEEDKDGKEKERDKNKNDGRATTTLRFEIPSPLTATTSRIFNRTFNSGTQLNIEMESSGSGAIEQNITTEIKSESRVEIKSGSNSDDERDED